jgi:tRNA(Ile)-lysidine synthase TilS/MesJ
MKSEVPVVMKKSIARISFIVHQNTILNRSDNLICGISGGQDSFLLVLILYHLKNTYKLTFTLVYFNHFWQIKNFYTVLHIIKFAYLIKIPINSIIAKTQLTSEEKGHFWRQKMFFNIANYTNTTLILVGHTVNDQIETALWHFFRGTSPKGLISLKVTSSLYSNKYLNKLIPVDFIQNSIKPSTRTKLKATFKVKILNNNKIPLAYFKYSKYSAEISNAVIAVDQAKHFERERGKRFFNTSNGCWDGEKSNFFLHPPEKYRVSYFFSSEFSKSKLSEVFLKDKNYYSYVLKKKTHSKYEIKRPLLQFHRSSISKLIEKNKLPLINDKTNQSKKLMRNKIRLLLMPLIHYYIQGKADINIKKFLTINAEEQKYLEKLSSTILSSYSNNPNFSKSLDFLPTGLQRLCIKNILEQYSAKQIKIQHIEYIQNYTKIPPSENIASSA